MKERQISLGRVPRLFIRKDRRYVLYLSPNESLNYHVECNPGTMRIEDEAGKVLWPE